MNRIRVPKYLRELFGETTTRFEVMMTLLFVAVVSSTVISLKIREFQALTFGKKWLVLLLLVDIAGGVIANLSLGTNTYYQRRPKYRVVLLLVHVQPLILLIAYPDYWQLNVSVWLYTIIGALIINGLNRLSFQPLIGMFTASLGLVLLNSFAKNAPSILLVVLTLYQLKLCFSFAINHFRSK